MGIQKALSASVRGWWTFCRCWYRFNRHDGCIILRQKTLLVLTDWTLRPPPVENINFIYGIYMYLPDTFSIADSYHQSFEFDKSATKNTHDSKATSNLPRRLWILMEKKKIAPSYGSFWIVGWCPCWSMPVNFCRGPIAWLRGDTQGLGVWGAGVGGGWVVSM